MTSSTGQFELPLPLLPRPPPHTHTSPNGTVLFELPPYPSLFPPPLPDIPHRGSFECPTPSSPEAHLRHGRRQHIIQAGQQVVSGRDTRAHRPGLVQVRPRGVHVGHKGAQVRRPAAQQLGVAADVRQERL
eukprot:303653-Chlamydomonas_euryale.AAC.1